MYSFCLYICLANINAIVANMEKAEKTFQREKSPQSKFMEKTTNFVDKIDKKMKQIQVRHFLQL